MNITLRRDADYDDFDHSITLADGGCDCTPEMKENLERGDEKICKSCAARQALNGLTSLYDLDQK